MKSKSKITRKRWTKRDTQVLLETVKNNPTKANIKRVARVLGRTTVACQFRYWKLNRVVSNTTLVNKNNVAIGKFPKQIREIRITNDGIRLIY